MKIAFFLYHWPVLSETFILNQLTWFIDQGHEVAIFCKSPSVAGETVEHEDIKQYHIDSKTFYYGVPSQRLPANRFVRIIKMLWILIRHLHRNPRPLLKSMNCFKYGRMATSLGMFYLTAPFLKWNMTDFDVACCHFGPNGELAATLKVLGVFNAKIVTIFHGEAGYTGKKELTKSLNTLFEVGDLFLPMSEKEKSNLIRRGCPAEKIKVHHMGVDISRFAARNTKNSRNGKVRLFSVGRLVEKKGFEYGIRAVAKVIRQFPDIEYCIIGEGPLASQLRDLIEDLNVTGQVKLMGAMTQKNVIEYLKSADLFMAPSVESGDGDQEGIPVVIMEAMALALPVLSTWHAGIPELVENERAGYLVPERDVDALVKRLIQMIEHPELWQRFGEEGRKKVESDFSVDKLNKRLMIMFQEVLKPDSNPVEIAHPGNL